VKPDLEVAVSLPDERAYQTNEFRRVVEGQPAGSQATLRLNEAELVRRRLSRGGDAEGNPHAPTPRVARKPVRLRSEPAPAPEALPVVQDPALARALDLLSELSTPAPPSEGDSR